MAINTSRDRDKTGTKLLILLPGTASEQAGRAYFLPDQQLKPVRVFQPDYLIPGTKHHAELLAALPTKESKQFQGLLLLRSIGESGDEPQKLKRRLTRYGDVRSRDLAQTAIKDAVESIEMFGPIEDSPNVYEAFRRSSSAKPHVEARFYLPPRFTEAMRTARLVLWWHEGKFTPAIYCPDVKTSLYVHAVLREYAACLCCGQGFFPSRPDQRYCSDSCGQRHRKRRQRQKD
jgi:hypothetical protein